MEKLGHGDFTTHARQFTRMFTTPVTAYKPESLLKLATDMADQPDSVKDGADPEENGLVPAGYTYFGQFIDHDLTFDSTSTLDSRFKENKASEQPHLSKEEKAAKENPTLPSNLRTPRLDLDCLYGDGPDAHPYLYDTDGASLLYQHSSPNEKLAQVDLMRSPTGRAIIGDKRNDENSIVSQIQLAFLKFHNEVVDRLKGINPKDLTIPFDLYKSARSEVRWTYQTLVLHDYLPRIVASEVLADLASAPSPGARKYVLYPDKNGNRSNLPREFVAAAYRFGHSMVRSGYRLNAGLNHRFHIFASSKPQANELKETPPSLIGFDPVPASHVIDDWKRFFPSKLHPAPLGLHLKDKAKGDDPDVNQVRMQFAYKIDPTIVDPLTVLPRAQVAGNGTADEAEKKIAPSRIPDPTGRPSLGLLNLLRGNSFDLVSGQTVAKAISAANLKPASSTLNLPLQAHHLCTREKFDGTNGPMMRFKKIASTFMDDTPLWFYVLAEAQAPLVDALWTSNRGDQSSAGFSEDKYLEPATHHTQLGWVGGRILSEVFYGILDSDPTSIFGEKAKGWQPMLGKGGQFVFADLLRFAGFKVSP